MQKIARKGTGLKSVSELLGMFKVETRENVKNLQEWQRILFEICEFHGVEGSREISSLISIFSKYRFRVNYLIYIQGWLKDYPGIQNNPIGLIIWKFQEDRKNEPLKFRSLYLGDPEVLEYKALRSGIKKFIRTKGFHSMEKQELLGRYRFHHSSLVERYKISKRPTAKSLQLKHEKVLIIFDKNIDKLNRARLFNA